MKKINFLLVTAASISLLHGKVTPSGDMSLEIGTENIQQQNTKEDKRDKFTGLARKNAGVQQKDTGTGTGEEDAIGYNLDAYEDVVIYHDTFKKDSDGYYGLDIYTKGVGNSISLATPSKDMLEYHRSLEENATSEEHSSNAENYEKLAYFGGGYCHSENTISISKASEFITMSCLMNFGNEQYRDVSVFAGIYPDYKREMLIGIPIYASLPSGERVNIDGIIMNKDRTTINIADYVDMQRVRKMVAENALAINDVAYRYSTAFMTALQASRIREEVEYVNTVDPNTGNTIPVPVATRNITPPKATDYFAAAGIEIVTQIFASVGKDYLYNTTPLFKLYKGKTLWVEGVFTFDHKGIANRFGTINKNNIENIKNNNDRYNNEKMQTIHKYDTTRNENTMLPNIGTRR